MPHVQAVVCLMFCGKPKEHNPDFPVMPKFSACDGGQMTCGEVRAAKRPRQVEARIPVAQWHFLPELMLTRKVFSGKTCRTRWVAGAPRTTFIYEAGVVSNVLLSLFAMLISGLPAQATGVSERDRGLAVVFREEDPAITAPIQHPGWLREPSQKRPVVRGQSYGGTYDSPPSTPPLAAPYQPYDPFALQAGPDPVLPYVNDPGQPVLSGVNGPQPERFGFTPMFDGYYLAPAGTSGPADGYFSVQAYDAALKYTAMLTPEWIFTNTAQAGVRLWDGPNYPDLPGSVYRFGWDFLLNSPTVGGWTAQLDFNPSINTDFDGSLGREAFNLDAYGALLYRTSPQWMWVLGVQYWDRVDNIIIPYAGAVWNPNERLELRMLFPKSRISYFLGNFGNGSHWLYAQGEYHVESYQIQQNGNRDQIQLADWRVGMGLRSDHQWYDKYFEVGLVFGRQNTFLNSTPDFNVNNGLMLRFGVRF